MTLLDRQWRQWIVINDILEAGLGGFSLEVAIQPSFITLTMKTRSLEKLRLIVIRRPPMASHEPTTVINPVKFNV